MIDFESEWNTLKNSESDYQQLKELMNKEYHWKCNKGHEWKSSLYIKMKGMSCPTCNKDKNSNILAYNNPVLTKEWNYKRNNEITPFNISKGSNKKVWWICEKGHEWETSVYHRNNGTACPYCKQVMKLNKEDIKTFAEERGGKLLSDLYNNSKEKLTWECDRGHKWMATVNSIKRGSWCPYCVGKISSDENSLATKFPELISEWHPTKNGDLTPKEVLPNSHKKVWWQCKNGHEWIARVGGRTQGTNCPFCSRKREKTEEND